MGRGRGDVPCLACHDCGISSHAAELWGRVEECVLGVVFEEGRCFDAGWLV